MSVVGIDEARRSSRECRISPLSLKPYRSNPDSRTEYQAVSQLKKEINQHGILSPLHVTHQYEIGDGNRRWKIASELGLTDVPVIIYPEGITADQLFIYLNNGTRPVGKRDKYQAALKGSPPATKQIQEYVTCVKSALSPDEFTAMMSAKDGGGTHIIDVAMKVMQYCPGDHLGRTKTDRVWLSFFREVLLWLTDAKLALSATGVRDMMHNRGSYGHINGTSLTRRILRRKPLTLRYSRPEAK